MKSGTVATQQGGGGSTGGWVGKGGWGGRQAGPKGCSALSPPPLWRWVRNISLGVVVVQSLSCVGLFLTPRTAATPAFPVVHQPLQFEGID